MRGKIYVHLQRRFPRQKHWKLQIRRSQTLIQQEEEEPQKINRPPEVETSPPVPYSELKQAFKCAAVPMIAFGFMDNTIMIYAGDFIDNHIGFTFGLATLVAAGFGQIFSDTSEFYLEIL